MKAVIATIDMATMQDKLAKLNKKAAKIGASPITVEVEKTYYKKYSGGGKIEVNDILIAGESFGIGGHTFIGTLDRESMEGSTIVKSAPGQSVPKEFYAIDQTCNHCNHKRFRKSTFVLQNVESSEYLQIGSSCIRDFLGYTPAAILSFYSLLDAMFQDFDREEYGSGYCVETYGVEKVLTVTGAAVDLYGFTSSSSQDEAPAFLRVK